MKKEIRALELKIFAGDTPSEIRLDIDNVQSEILQMMNVIQQDQICIAKDVAEIKTKLKTTFGLVTDLRYKVRRHWQTIYCNNESNKIIVSDLNIYLFIGRNRTHWICLWHFYNPKKFWRFFLLCIWTPNQGQCQIKTR